MRIFSQYFFLTVSLSAFASYVYSLPGVDGFREEGFELHRGFEVEQMTNFFDDVASLNLTIADMSKKLSNLKRISGVNANNSMNEHEGLDNSADSLKMLEDNVQSFHANFDSLNISIEGIETTLDMLEGDKSRIIFEKMIQNPRAKLYTGLNHTESFENYDFIMSTYKGGCYNLTTSKGKVKSVDTGSKCVRIFKMHSCASWSQAFYRGSSKTIDSILEGGESIGPCASNEFEYATLNYLDTPSSKTVKKSDKQVQAYANVSDLISDFWMFDMVSPVSDNSTSITQYKFGQYESRLEAVCGLIYARHLLTTENAEVKRIAGAKESFYTGLALNNGTDELGFALPLELGGSTGERFNVFPQNRAKVEEYRSLFVPQIKKHLEEYPGEVALLAMKLIYSHENTKRPAGIWYRIFKTGVNEITYGYFSN